MILARERAHVPEVIRSRAPLRWVVVALARWFCRPLIVLGSPPLDAALLASNHASHADTAALLAALPRDVRARTSPAAAEDYFFRSRIRGAVVRALTGAFPFPRTGRAGLERARALQAGGGTVVLFPEGTRSTTDGISSFKRGIGHLASEGVPVVPVAIAGTRDVLAKGARLPRRAPVVVAFGRVVHGGGGDPGEIAARLEDEVRRLHAQAVAARPAPTPSVYTHVRRFAHTPRAVALCLAWGLAEALLFPIVPDVAVALLAVAAPARAPLFVLAAVSGSTAGGLVAYAAGPAFVDHLPLVTERMADAAAGWLRGEGAGGLAHQPWSGVPYKAFAYQAADAGVPAETFAMHTLFERGLRFAEVAAVFASIGLVGRRVGDRLYGAFCVCALAMFSVGLVRVVGSWS